jgi:hypothetical protein
MSILINSYYDPRRGGRAPGDLHVAFLDAIDAYAEWDGESVEPCVDVRGKELSISRVCGLLWNCSDIFPDRGRWGLELVQIGELPTRNTYAAAARYLKELIQYQWN